MENKKLPIYLDSLSRRLFSLIGNCLQLHNASEKCCMPALVPPPSRHAASWSLPAAYVIAWIHDSRATGQSRPFGQGCVSASISYIWTSWLETRQELVNNYWTNELDHDGRWINFGTTRKMGPCAAAWEVRPSAHPWYEYSSEIYDMRIGWISISGTFNTICIQIWVKIWEPMVVILELCDSQCCVNLIYLLARDVQA